MWAVGSFQPFPQRCHEGGTLLLRGFRDVGGEQFLQGLQCLGAQGGSAGSQAALIVAIGQ